MKIKEIAKKIWNSEIFEFAVDTYCGILSCFCEVLLELFTPKEINHSESIIYNDESNNTTYNYWMSLSYQEQYDYFHNNEYLRQYATNDYYSSDRHLTAIHVQHIANNLNKEFIDKYDRY